MFDTRLRALRKSRNLTQSQLAKLLFISPSAVGMYEQGRRRPDAKMLQNICGLFGVSMDYLIGLTSEKVSADDLSILFEGIRFQLLSKDRVSFNGRTLSRPEIERLLDAMDLTLNLVLNRDHSSADRATEAL